MKSIFDLIKSDTDFSQNFSIYYLVYLKNCLYYININFYFFLVPITQL